MKRIVVILFAILILFGCTIQEKHSKDNVYKYAQSVATGRIESEFGYHQDSVYSLQKVKGEKDVFPYIYQVTKDDTPIFTIEFQYENDIVYGGWSFKYKEGYVVPYVQIERFITYSKEDIEYSVVLNDAMEYIEYQEVQLVRLNKSSEEIIGNKLDDESADFHTYYVSMSRLESQKGDEFTLYTPIKLLSIDLNAETKCIDVFERKYYDFPIYRNGELTSVWALSMGDSEESWGLGIDHIDDAYYQLLKGNQKFVRVVFGTIYHQEVFVLEDGTIVGNGNYPVYVSRAIDAIKEYLANEESLQIYKEIK